MLIAGVPPLVVAHAIAPPQFPPAMRFQYFGTPAPNVIPVFPLQSPKRVPLMGAAAPAMVMSRKSKSAEPAANVPTVNVRGVPITEEATSVRMVASVPAESVSVPVIVWSAPNEITLMPAAVLPANVKLAKVFAVASVGFPVMAVNVTLLNVRPPIRVFAPVPERLKVEVPALNVRFVEIDVLNEVAEIVPEPKVMDRELELLEEIAPHENDVDPVLMAPFVTVKVLRGPTKFVNVQPHPMPLTSNRLLLLIVA